MKNLIYTLIISFIIISVSSCCSTSPKSNIEEFEKNDNYIPWWIEKNDEYSN